MSYCQDCGAHNEAGRIDCRICGRPLERERGTIPCSICHRPLGLEATFCADCGAPVPLGVGVVRRPTLPTAGGAHSPAGLGSDLNLPDWLRQAAAVTPEAPPTAEAVVAEAFLPTGFVVGGAAGSVPVSTNGVAVPHGAGDVRPAHLAHAGSEPESLATEQPLPPLPDGGLAAAMPAWLQAQPVEAPPQQPSDSPRDTVVAPRPAAVETAGQDRLAAPAPPATPPAAQADGANPASFIGENDLPSWIRELVAKEEAEAEVARVAAEAEALAAAEAEAAARARAEAAGASSERLRSTGGLSGVETGAGRPRSWLDRGDRGVDVAANAFDQAAESVDGRSTVFAEVVETRAVALGTDRLKPRPELMQPEQPTPPPPPARPAKSPAPAAADPSPSSRPSAAGRGLPVSPLQLGLMAAIVVALLLLVVKLFVL